MTRVVVIMEGGVIQEVLSDNPCKVITLDYDAWDEDFDQETMLKDNDTWAYVSIENALRSGNPQRVNLIRKMLHDQGFRDA